MKFESKKSFLVVTVAKCNEIQYLKKLPNLQLLLLSLHFGFYCIILSHIFKLWRHFSHTKNTLCQWGMHSPHAPFIHHYSATSCSESSSAMILLVTVDGSTSIHADMSQNGLNHMSGLPSSNGTVSLSPDGDVKEADTTDLSQTSHATSPVSHTRTLCYSRQAT